VEDFRDRLAVDYRSKEHLDRYLMPLDHPVRGFLERVFSTPGVTDSLDSIKALGFQIILSMPQHAVIMQHPSAPGYIFKIYPDSQSETEEGISSAEWFLRRCEGASKIRALIQKKGIRHFVVPDKWLYLLPHAKHHRLLLVATDMNLVTKAETEAAWRQSITRDHLYEFYAIVSAGYGSVELVDNVPYTKEGTFAFIDTEKLKRRHDLSKVKKHLSKEMRHYWQMLLDAK